VGLLRTLLLLACGAAIGVGLVVSSFVNDRDALELLDAASRTSADDVGAAITGARDRATERAKRRAADVVSDVAADVVDAVAERLKAETDRAAEDAKRSVSEGARARLGLSDEEHTVAGRVPR